MSKNKQSLIFIVLITNLFSLPSWASDASNGSSYIRLDSGYSFTAKKTNFTNMYGDLDKSNTPGFTSFIVGAGIRLFENLRSDLTLNYNTPAHFKLTNASPTQDFYSKSLVGLFNLYCDFNVMGKVQPYIMGGVGLAHNEVGSFTLQDSSMMPNNITFNPSVNRNFAWAVGGGGAFRLSPEVLLDMSYKFVDLGKIKTSAPIIPSLSAKYPFVSKDIYTHQIMVGLRFEI